MTLFFGLLFLTNKFDNKAIQTTAVVISTTLIVVFNIIVCLFVIWDIIIRNRSTRKQKKRKRRVQRIIKIRENERKKNSVQETNEDYQFHFRFREVRIPDEDENIKTMNDIIFDLLAWRRVRQNFARFQKKNSKVKKKVTRISLTTSKFSHSDVHNDDLDALSKLKPVSDRIIIQAQYSQELKSVDVKTNQMVELETEDLSKPGSDSGSNIVYKSVNVKTNQMVELEKEDESNSSDTMDQNELENSQNNDENGSSEKMSTENAVDVTELQSVSQDEINFVHEDKESNSPKNSGIEEIPTEDD